MHAVYVELVPVAQLLVYAFEAVMALLDLVRGYVGIQVVDVVILDAVGEGLQQQGYLQVCTALQTSFYEIPLLLTYPVGHVDRVLQVEQYTPNHRREPKRHARVCNRHPDDGEQEEHAQEGNGLFEKAPAEQAIPIDDQYNEAIEPNEGDGDEKEYDGFAEYSDEDPFEAGHMFVLLFGEDDSLREVEPVKVAEVFVVVVVAVPPGVEGVVRVYAVELADYAVHLDVLEEGKVRHVVELREHADEHEAPQETARELVLQPQQHDSQQLKQQGHPHCQPGLTVLRLTKPQHVLFNSCNLLLN